MISYGSINNLMLKHLMTLVIGSMLIFFFQSRNEEADDMIIQVITGHAYQFPA